MNKNNLSSMITSKDINLSIEPSSSSSVILSSKEDNDNVEIFKAPMNDDNGEENENDENFNIVNDWEYAKIGIVMWLNNDPKGAEKHFKDRESNTKIFAGYAFTTVMNAVISYELDKIELAQSMLKELEQRCSQENGWFQSVRARIFGSRDVICKPLTEELEDKIILADCLICSAILTFLTQDISGLMKGSWLLRKAWKIYQQTYTQIFQIYEEVEKASNKIKDYKMKKSHNGVGNFCRSSMVRSKTTNIITSPKKYCLNTNDVLRKSLNQMQSKDSSVTRYMISHFPKTIPSKLPNLKNLSTNLFVNQNSNEELNQKKEKSSLSSSKFSSYPSKSNLFLDLQSSPKIKSSCFIQQVPISCPETISTPFTKMPPFDLSDINLQLIKRLMGAVSFGYGLFQLSISLLPPNLMKFISLFGFEGDKNLGISCLLHSNNSEDMRAPLAKLALLWYYTIGAQLFHIYDEGTNMENEIFAAKELLKQSQDQYTTSAIFLFFRARIKRLQCNTNLAIEFYDAAYRMSAQKELKLLCLHEVGWCRLIELDFGNAILHFHELRLASNFSKSFYTYMTTICQGAFGRFDNLIKLRNELLDIINRHKNRETQIDNFILRRINKLPSKDNPKNLCNVKYFKFFIYEMLFLWNTLYSCSKDVLNSIIADCSQLDDDDNNTTVEPFIGLSELIMGCCEAYLKNFSIAITALRKCIRKREGLTDDLHVSAFAHYELALLLIKQKSDYAIQEAKNILLYAQNFFKNYDFESRLSARIYSTLQNLQ